MKTSSNIESEGGLKDNVFSSYAERFGMYSGVLCKVLPEDSLVFKAFSRICLLLLCWARLYIKNIFTCDDFSHF